MEMLARWLSSSWTVVWLIACLSILAAVFFWMFRRVVLASKLALKSGIDIVESVADRAEFAEKYLDVVDRVNVAFSGNRPLNQQWQRFQSQLTRGEDGNILSYREPEDFFNSAFLLRDRWLPLCKAGPSYLVGIGLVFTFLGIAVVIYRASLALGSNNDLQALRDLLGAAALKFWTSLAGVALSVLLSGYFRYLIARFNVSASDFSYALSTRVQILSQEYSLQLSNTLLTRQLEATNELRTTLGQREEESAERIVRELQGLREGMVNVTENTFSQLVEKSTSELSQAISQSLQGVAQTFISINANLDEILERVQGLPEHYRLLAQEVTRSTREITTRVQETEQSLALDLDRAKGSSGEIAEHFSAGSKSAGLIVEAVASVHRATTDVTESLGRLSSLQDVSQQLQEAAVAVRSSSDALVVNWKAQADHVALLDEKLGSTVATLPVVFTQYSESLQKFTDDFDNHLGRVLGSLAMQVALLDSSQSNLRLIAEAIQHASPNHNGSSEITPEVI